MLMAKYIAQNKHSHVKQKLILRHTDSGATLDIKKYNGSLENQAAICIYFVNINWRRVKYRRAIDDAELIDNETTVSGSETWIFFRYNFSGQKNDHVFHNACQTYIVKYYNK